MKAPIADFEELLNCYASSIKDVYIELDDYEFFHSPYGEGKPDKRFIGRRKIVNHLKTLLLKSSTKSGAYLITGFRGMGKTSVVRKAIYEVNEEEELRGKTKDKSARENSDSKKRFPEKHVIRAFYYIVTGVFGVGLLTFILLCTGMIMYLHRIPFKWLTPNFFFDVSIPEDFLVKLILYILLWLLIFPIFPYLIDLISRSEEKSERLKYLKEKRYKKFEINLSQETVNEIDILKQIARRLQDYWEERLRSQDILEDRNLYFLWRLFSRLVRKGSKGSEEENIRQKLRDLNNRINAQVTSERETVQGGDFSFSTELLKGNLPSISSSKKDSLNYPIANNKEIEQDLIEILRLIDDYRERGGRNIPLFLFVIDELDKIVPNSSSTILERESADPYFDPTDSSSTNIVRQRQEAVGNLLANLKGFLNVAMAKFIFIGGREMFDASLADIADRDSFYSSIFNDVIYVNSFFKDKIQKEAGITRMTEAYLCELIIPECFLRKYGREILEIIEAPDMVNPVVGEKVDLDPMQKEAFYSLKVCQLFLAWSFFEKEKLEDNLSVLRNREKNTDDIRVAKLMKIISLLQNYIIYLTYRSNGSPKRLTTLIENLIVPGEANFLDDNRTGKYLVVENSKTEKKYEDRLFLNFNYDMQFEIGLTSDIYRPYIIAHSRFLKSLGDKILFSSAFILDHLLKFHSFGFSLRNLELIPEVILVNKEPNLRLYIDQLLNYLLEGYLRNTLGSLFDYKFNSIIAIELRYLSKISELGSAAFNFTLDESLQIKRHYKRKLQELEKKYQNYEPIQGDNQFIHSIAFIQNILGDLHYYDQEFDEALIFYNEAIQTIRLPDESSDKITRHQFFLWVRRNLKAALTLEQIGAYDSAYSYYRTLNIAIAKKITAHRSFFLEQQKKEIIAAPDQRPGMDVTPYQYIQILYTPLIALLALLEKYRFDGFTFLDLLKSEREVNYLLGIHHLPFQLKITVKTSYHLAADEARQSRLFTLKADYLNNVGNLLYFKNKVFTDQILEEKISRTVFPVAMKIIDHFRVYLNHSEEHTKDIVQDYRPSVYSYLYYYRALNVLLQAIDQTEGNPGKKRPPSIWEQCYYLCEPGRLHLLNDYKKFYIGNLLSNLGNCILAMIHHRDSAFDEKVLIIEPPELFLSTLKSIIANEVEIPLNITFVMALYRLAGRFYRKANQLHAYSFQLRKLLYVLKDYIQLLGNQKERWTNFEEGDRTELIHHAESIAMEVVRASSWNNDITNRPQILKYRDILNIHVQERKTRITGVLDNLAGMYPVKEAVLLTESIRLKLRPDRAIRPGLTFMSSYSNISNKSIRMQELRYLSDFYYQVFKTGFFKAAEESPEEQDPEEVFNAVFEKRFLYEADEAHGVKELKNYYEMVCNAAAACAGRIFQNEKEDFSQPGKRERVLTFLITEAITCKYEVIKILNIYTPGYIASYSFLASVHYKMARWCRLLENIFFFEKKLSHEKTIYQETVRNVGEEIGSHNMIYLDSNHHFELAVQCYYRALQLHTEGRTYRIEARKQFFLEDDYNDQLKHFNAAMERYRINVGATRSRIREIKKNSQDISILYQYPFYFPTREANI